MWMWLLSCVRAPAPVVAAVAPPAPIGAVACYEAPAPDAEPACLPVGPLPVSAHMADAYTYPPPLGGSDQYTAPRRYVDLSRVDPEEKLAANFVVREFMRHGSGRWAVYQRDTVHHLQGVRDLLGGPVIITSGYRDVAHNRRVGGVRNSRHVFGDAADMQAAGRSLQDLAEACRAEGADFVSVYVSHVHCDWRDDPLDPAFFGEVTPSVAQRPQLEARLVHVDGVWHAPALGFDEGEPLRVWEALVDGVVVARETSTTFVAPAGTERVRVRVGGDLVVIEGRLGQVANHATTASRNTRSRAG